MISLDFESKRETTGLKSLGFCHHIKETGWIIFVHVAHGFGREMEFDSQ